MAPRRAGTAPGERGGGKGRALASPAPTKEQGAAPVRAARTTQAVAADPERPTGGSSDGLAARPVKRILTQGVRRRTTFDCKHARLRDVV